MSTFFHGVKTSQVPTSLIPPARVNASLTMAFGTAPIHRLSPEAQEKVKPGNITLLYSNAEAIQNFGIDASGDDFSKWGLSEVAFSHFSLFNVAPVIFANLFDPAIHKTSVTGEVVNFVEGVAKLANGDIIGDVVLSSYTEDTDYILDRVTGEIEVILGSSLATALNGSPNITASYIYADPSKVTASDCIGGYDMVTGKTTGIELVELAFPKYRMTPGILLAPNFSRDPSVASILAVKATYINDIFNAVAFADLPDDEVTVYSDAPAYKNNNNLVSENLYICYGKVKFGDRLMNLSTQAAGIQAQVDSKNADIPYGSPSNNNLQAQALLVNGEELWLDLTKANYLNANGIATGINFANGWVLWGNRTSAYPSNTDPKDSFLSSRRMLAWYGNRLILTYFQKVDKPINRVLIQSILNSEAMSINALVAMGALTGGRVEFDDSENPLIDIMDGIMKFHIYLGLTVPAESIEFKLEFDPSYFSALFS